MEEDSHSQVTCTLSQLTIPTNKLLSFNIRKIHCEVERPRCKITLAEKLNSKLYEKYCSSQNFYYTKEIDNILCGVKSAGSIQYTEEVAYMTELERKEEMLKRYYKRGEYPKKIKLLSEYYKFHEDVPRLAMLPLSSLIHSYHDQKRRINYIKITKMLNNGKIDSEIIRNMDPNEDSDLSRCSVASSLLSFLPEEFKLEQLTSARTKPVGNGKWKAKAKGEAKSKSREAMSIRHKPKKKDFHINFSKKKIEKLSPISSKKGEFYLERPVKKNKKKSESSLKNWKKKEINWKTQTRTRCRQSKT